MAQTRWEKVENVEVGNEIIDGLDEYVVDDVSIDDSEDDGAGCPNVKIVLECRYWDGYTLEKSPTYLTHDPSYEVEVYNR